jgi:peptidylprolyl isomerase
MQNPDDVVVLTLKSGDVTIALRPDLAPLHVARIKELAGAGFYDGHAFHRVIPEFMAQTGDPTGTGTGRSHLPMLKAEFSPERHLRGTLSMARAADPDSANSQFFICLADCPWLDRQYTVFGQVVEGMEHVDAIKKGGKNNNGAIAGEPDRIVKMRVGANKS